MKEPKRRMYLRAAAENLAAAIAMTGEHRRQRALARLPVRFIEAALGRLAGAGR